MDATDVQRWVVAYERAWRTEGIDSLAEVFTPDVSYRPSPWVDPIEGLTDLGAFWEAERKGPDEEFALSCEVVAVDGSTAVVRVSVDYGAPLHSRWRDLWVLELTTDGRCTAFEEWPFAPGQPDGH